MPMYAGYGDNCKRCNLDLRDQWTSGHIDIDGITYVLCERCAKEWHKFHDKEARKFVEDRNG
jgi:hypothetical protein